MADSTTNLDLISLSTSQKEVTANALIDALSTESLFGRRASTCAGLVWGYYGGKFLVAGAPTAIANGTITLTAGATNYLYATSAGVVTKTTSAPSGWPGPLASAAVALYQIVVGSSTVTSYTDYRTPGLGAASGSGALLSANNLSDVANAGTSRTNLGLGTAATHADSEYARALAPTAVKTGAYTAAANDLVPVDTTSAAVTITLPTAPADKTLIGVKQVIQGGTNTVTIARGGSDVFNKAAGPTSLTLTLLNQGVLLQYASSTAIWYVLSDDLPLAQLDTRYSGGVTGTGYPHVTSGTEDAAAVGAQRYPIVSSPSYSSSMTLDARNGDAFVITLTGNLTLDLSNGNDQQTVRVELVNTNGATFALGTGSVASSSVPAPTRLSAGASAIDEMLFKYSSTKGKWMLMAYNQGF